MCVDKAMSFFLYVITSLGVAFLAHLALWRIRLPTAQLKVLLLVFFMTWCTAVVVAWLSNWRFVSFADGQAAVGFLYFCLFYWAAALCYVITYSAMEGDSPTLSLTRHLHKKGPQGISHEEIEKFFRQRPFVGARVKALVTDDIFLEESGGYRLASGKYLFFRLILGYRRVVFGPIKSGG
jgi:hypothetical protein